MALDLAHVRSIERENGRLRRRIEDLEHEVRMLKQLARVPDEWALQDVPSSVCFTPSERAILHRLHGSYGATVAKLGLLEAIEGSDHVAFDTVGVKIIDVFVCKIRRKLIGSPWRIKTKWGIGYFLVRDRAIVEAA